MGYSNSLYIYIYILHVFYHFLLHERVEKFFSSRNIKLLFYYIYICASKNVREGKIEGWKTRFLSFVSIFCASYYKRKYSYSVLVIQVRKSRSLKFCLYIICLQFNCVFIRGSRSSTSASSWTFLLDFLANK